MQEELGDDANRNLIRARAPRFGRTGRLSRDGQVGKELSGPSSVGSSSGGSSIGSAAEGFVGTVAGGVATGGILLGLGKAISEGDQVSAATAPLPAEPSDEAVAA